MDCSLNPASPVLALVRVGVSIRTPRESKTSLSHRRGLARAKPGLTPRLLNVVTKPARLVFGALEVRLVGFPRGLRMCSDAYAMAPNEGKIARPACSLMVSRPQYYRAVMT